MAGAIKLKWDYMEHDEGQAVQAEQAQQAEQAVQTDEEEQQTIEDTNISI